MYSFIVAILVAFSLTACWKAPEVVKDLSDFPQNHLAYFNNRNPELLAAENQRLLNEDYNIIYFSVWHQKGPFYAVPDAVNIDFRRFDTNFGFDAKGRAHTGKWHKKLLTNAALNKYPNSGYAAITIRNASLRILPTQNLHFSSPNGGDLKNWPFDNLQRTAVTVNTPVFVCHISADKAWALVETCYTFGWMPVADFARVDKEFIDQWEKGRYAVVTRDLTNVVDKKGLLFTKSSLGYIFPLVRELPEKLEIYTAAADKKSGRAIIRSAYVSRNAAVVKPLKFTSANAVIIANELINEPYGWGGLNDNRDCSSMTRDFFAVFGIWLPRHSEDQVKEAGTYIDLNGMSAAQKEKMILEKGVPYLTLLWRKGHVMMYIGAKNGRALIFHNIWGVRTKDLTGREGRRIIGKAVITSLYPGWELRHSSPGKNDLLTNISGMSILAPQQKTATEKAG